MNIRDYASKFWANSANAEENPFKADPVGYSKSLMELSIQIYKDMLEIVKTFDLEEFEKEDMKDYFEELMPVVEAIEDEDSLCAAGLVFLTVKPFGEKMTALHLTIMDEVEQRKFLEQQ
jgi:hypothetical protein